MKKIITTIIVFVSLNNYSQKIEVHKNKKKEVDKIRVTLKKDYTAYFFVNSKLIMKKKYKGLKTYKLANLKNYVITSTINKKAKILNIFFDNDLEDFIEDRIIDIQKIF